MRVTIAAVGSLDPGHVLSPLRYGSGRDAQSTGRRHLGDLVASVHDTVSPRTATAPPTWLVLDTTHARNGLIDVEAAAANTSVGSSKRRVMPGDVVVSRLRPYLRQVAYVDPAASPIRPICCSTEFYVLRSRDGSSIAYLVAWLLSAPIQLLLADAQEGGHHPRVSEDALLRLTVPDTVWARREEVSAHVEAAASAYREARRLLAAADGLTQAPDAP